MSSLLTLCGMFVDPLKVCVCDMLKSRLPWVFWHKCNDSPQKLDVSDAIDHISVRNIERNHYSPPLYLQY